MQQSSMQKMKMISKCKYTSTQIHKYTSTQVHNYTSTQIHKYTNTQIHKYTNTQIHKYTNYHKQIILTHEIISKRSISGCKLEELGTTSMCCAFFVLILWAKFVYVLFKSVFTTLRLGMVVRLGKGAQIKIRKKSSLLPNRGGSGRVVKCQTSILEKYFFS